MTPDTLCIQIELPDGKYSSENNKYAHGLAYGKKSDIYKHVFDVVKTAAEAEIDRTGWVKAECECSATIMRVMPKRWRADASNLAKAEWDSLTAAGVWADDRLANPTHKLIRYDKDGPHRVVIVVMKLHEPANVIADAPKPKREPKQRALEPIRESIRRQPSIHEPVAYLNGKPISIKDAMEMIKK